jgi:hypothetical protein
VYIVDELLSVLIEIRDQLFELNSKIDKLTGFGKNDLSDIVTAVDNIRGDAGYDLTDVCDKLADVCDKLDVIDSTIMMKD